jgi:hypothetical protein
MTDLVKDRTLLDKELESIKTSIENKMNKQQHLEILKILKDNTTVKLNENRNGVYINLSFLSDGSIEELRNYVSYIEDREKALEVVELQKQVLSSQVV